MYLLIYLLWGEYKLMCGMLPVRKKTQRAQKYDITHYNINTEKLKKYPGNVA